MARVSRTSTTKPQMQVVKAAKKIQNAPPLSGRYARSEGAGPGPERHHNGRKRS